MLLNADIADLEGKNWKWSPSLWSLSFSCRFPFTNTSLAVEMLLLSTFDGFLYGCSWFFCGNLIKPCLHAQAAQLVCWHSMVSTINKIANILTLWLRSLLIYRHLSNVLGRLIGLSQSKGQISSTNELTKLINYLIVMYIWWLHTFLCGFYGEFAMAWQVLSTKPQHFNKNGRLYPSSSSLAWTLSLVYFVYLGIPSDLRYRPEQSHHLPGLRWLHVADSHTWANKHTCAHTHIPSHTHTCTHAHMGARRIFGRVARGDRGPVNLRLGQSGTTTLILHSLLCRHVMIQVHAMNDYESVLSELSEDIQVTV